MPVIAMPPVQRTAVWRPKQVLDLWDSLMRGLPIGTFYLVDYNVGRPADAQKVIPFGGGGTTSSEHAGFDLLDGQQRVRALWVGVHGFAEEKRCLWVDLAAKNAKEFPCLLLTSKAQPFGYDGKTGRKLGIDERRKARNEIEPKWPEVEKERYLKQHIMVRDRDGELRKAYDQELFEDTIAPEGVQIVQPPLPYEAHKGKPFKLHELLAAWRKRSVLDPDGGINALRRVTGESGEEGTYIDPALRALDTAFRRVEKAQVALLRVAPDDFCNRDADLLALFERIGAGGTALTDEERLFSIYKYHVPEIRDAVDQIYDAVGHVLPPTKIAATALRIANALTNKAQNNTPDVVIFAKEMVEPESLLRKELKKLIPENGPHEPVERVRDLLSYSDDAGAFWMPDVLLADLPAELWQVLVFWLIERPELANTEISRKDAVRFALFWHFCASNHDKAARWSFEYLKEDARQIDFPGAELYRRLIGADGGESCATALIASSDFKLRLCKSVTDAWRTDAARFVDDDKRNDVGSNWWWQGRKMLPWLQRDYITGEFPDYTPLTDNDDDLPYDVDHICAYNDWGNWFNVRHHFHVDVDIPTQDKMRAGRHAVGNGIGNLRLIDSSINGSDQDDDIIVKMPFVLSNVEPTSNDQRAMAEFAFPPADRALWLEASGTDKIWDNNRLAKFQEAVERRATWLYHRFHDDLDFAAWTMRGRQQREGPG